MEKASVVSYLTKLASEMYPNPIRGGQLSDRLKAAFPNFNALQFGCKNLRDFIRDNVPEVSEGGKAGMDVIYGLRTQQAEMFEPEAVVVGSSADRRAPLGQLLTNPRIWKTFASPQTLFRLYLLPSGLIRILRPDETADPAWPEIKPISADALRKIASDFIGTLHQSQQDILVKQLDAPKWWLPFFELVSTLGLRTRWISYRRQRIAEEFETALSQAIASVVSASPSSVKSEGTSLPPDQHKLPDPLLRRIASSAVQRMTDSELRALNLPLGYVIDALTTK
jgi:hypothetical protein